MTEQNEQNREIRRVTWWGAVINVILAIGKCSAGWLGGSQALVADGIHSLSDLISDALILFGVHFWTKPADECHPHGHGRYEIAVTLWVGLLLLAAGGGILWHAYQAPVSAEGPKLLTLWVALGSIAAKEFLFRWTDRVGRQIQSAALRANAWHHRSDAFSSVPVAVAILGSFLMPEWTGLDRIGAVIVALFIMNAARKIILNAWNQLMDVGADADLIEKLTASAFAIEGVEDVHKVRSRFLCGSTVSVDLHVTVDPQMSVYDGHEIASLVKRTLIQEFSEVNDVIVHIEPASGARV